MSKRARLTRLLRLWYVFSLFAVAATTLAMCEGW